jgi:hypothetical protein
MAPVWYKIGEIPFSAYVKALQGLYTVLEKKNTSKGSDDIFLKSVVSGFIDMDAKAWELAEGQRRYEKALQMKMGDFHEELAGKFPGYETLVPGHETGCDVMKSDGSEVWEWKNRDNTMNSGSGKSVIDKLVAVADSGKKPFLVLVNCVKKKVPRFGAPDSITVLNGRDAYAYLSGRDTFFADLNSTLSYTFTKFKKYEELEEFVKDKT